VERLSDRDLLGHAMVIGATGSGKTNFLLYTMHHIHRSMDAAVIFVDPHGQASLDLARMIPETRVFDPTYSPFGLNPLELGPYSSKEDRALMVQLRVGELLRIMEDLFSVTVDRAPRLLWILRGALLYLYTLTDTPTFLDLYYLLTDLMGMDESEAAEFLEGAGLDDETVRRTLEAISKLESAAFTAVLNRISNFVLPPGSLTAKTFCSRRTTVPFAELLRPGSISAFRLPTYALPEDFRRVATSTIVMDVYFEVQRRFRSLELGGAGVSSFSGGPAPVYLVIDEFQNVADLDLLKTILAEARKFGLYLIVAHQNIAQVREDLFQSFAGNAALVVSFRVGPDDALKMKQVLNVRDQAVLTSLPNYTAIVRRNPVGGGILTYYMRVPRAPAPVLPEDEVLRRLREAPPTANEDRSIVYRRAMEGAAERSGRPPLTPARWAVLAAVRLGMASTYRALVDLMYHRYAWDESVTLSAINYLMDSGLLVAAGASADTKYEVTREAERYFHSAVAGPRAGGPVHNAIVRKLLHDYWERGYYCEVDDGSPGPEKPDIVVWRPVARRVESKFQTREERDPARWDPEPVAIEVETMLGRRRQILRNLEKVKRYPRAAFVTDSNAHKEKLRAIMREAGIEYPIEVVNIGMVEQTPAEEDLDSFLVTLILNGWPGEEKAAELAGADVEDVREHLEGLTEAGVIRRREDGSLEAVVEAEGGGPGSRPRA
jgi:DNA-binding transcriptional ArsR family regulator